MKQFFNDPEQAASLPEELDPETVFLKGCALGDRELCRTYLLNNVWRRAAAWKTINTELVGASGAGTPIVPAPEPALELLRVHNRAEGLSQFPTSSKLGDAELREVSGEIHEALAELPARVLQEVIPNLVGIYLADNLGYSGITFGLWDEKGEPGGALIVLDLARVRRRANEWISLSESSLLSPSPGYALEIEAEEPAGNTRKNAFQLLLLHEFGHVVEIMEKRIDWITETPGPESLKRHPFLALSWKHTKDGYRAIHADKVPARSGFNGPMGKTPKLSVRELPAAYRKLARTDFLTLYGTTRPNEDFADSFAIYVHTQILKKPFRVQVKRNGKVLHRHEACWQEERCRNKRLYFDQMFLTPKGMDRNLAGKKKAGGTK